MGRESVWEERAGAVRFLWQPGEIRRSSQAGGQNQMTSTEEDNRALGEAIRQARTRLGITQEEMAQRLNIATIHLKNMEGGRRNPSTELLFRIMRIMDLSVDPLLFPEVERGLNLEGLSQHQMDLLAGLVETMREERS